LRQTFFLAKKMEAQLAAGSLLLGAVQETKLAPAKICPAGVAPLRKKASNVKKSNRKQN